MTSWRAMNRRNATSATIVCNVEGKAWPSRSVVQRCSTWVCGSAVMSRDFSSIGFR